MRKGKKRGDIGNLSINGREKKKRRKRGDHLGEGVMNRSIYLFSLGHHWGGVIRQATV